MWKCQECSRRYKKCRDICAVCGGSDIDLEVSDEVQQDVARNAAQLGLAFEEVDLEMEITNHQTGKRYVWRETATGGGCTALELQRNGGGLNWLITAIDDPSTPKDLHKDECFLGGYTSDGQDQVVVYRFPSAAAAVKSYSRMSMKRDCIEVVSYE